MNSQIRFTALIVALLLGTAACTHNSDSPAEITGKTADCNKLKSSIPKDFIQGTVEVPEDYDHPEGQKIHVFYYGRVGTAENPTIVFFNGGPVSDSHGSWQSPTRITDQSEEAKKIWPMIFIDQRGTGCSSEFPRLQSEAEYIRYAHWGSKEIVKDAEVIRKKIQGGLRWKAFGQSYGGFITQRYLQVAPEGIRSMHVHGFTSGRDIDQWMAG
ncbi:MAG: alpha/beta fold hydrolase, partial [Bdellovibrionales bacterium]